MSKTVYLLVPNPGIGFSIPGLENGPRIAIQSGNASHVDACIEMQAWTVKLK